MNFKYSYLKQEFHKNIFPNLRALLFELDHFSKEKFNKEIYITQLLRSQDEQNELYEYKIKAGFYTVIDGWIYYSLDKEHPTYSVHQVGRGADLRSSIYTSEEIEEICKYVNEYFPYWHGKPACVYHKIYGNVYHFHFQVIPTGHAPIDYSSLLKPKKLKWRVKNV